MSKMSELFGSMVFNDTVMKERLPNSTYKQLQKNIKEGTSLELPIANVVANAMKDWAIEKGCTHFTHWFQPMTGVTAEKHEGFMNPTSSGSVIMEFSGKELIRGEPDASSFPSGGLRATFEARGYTAWDPTSHAFIKSKVLCIPTIFCSYSGDVLDKKTPLLRSQETLSKQAMRILKLFDNSEASKVVSTVGPEQEYFLISKELFEKRKDLVYCGRTLFGNKPPKGQDLDDHYFGIIKQRVSDYMHDLDEELWKLGIFAKTKHNEVAPAQHELAPVFTTTNIATDHNQLTMETMKKVATRHGMVCLLHEKPFAGVNGSGKHNNWSISTDTGTNLLEPGKSPSENAQFLLFLTAVIKAIDEYQDLMRMAAASAGNDHRLGANEAPPAIISVFLGDELTAILDSIVADKKYVGDEKIEMTVGVDVLPKFFKDTTDRNRTSPFAFTGNKFEFRMMGSSQSISGPNFVLNTIVAEELEQFANQLEASKDFEKDLHVLIRETIKDHSRIIFNGNNYSDEWVQEAERRGLCNYKSTPECMSHWMDEKNVKLFEKHGIFNSTEMQSRTDIFLENYFKTINIEANTALEIARKEILPAVVTYMKELTDTIIAKQSIAGVSSESEQNLLSKLSSLSDSMYEKIDALDKAVQDAVDDSDVQACADYYHDVVFTAMQDLRSTADELEKLTAEKYWPYPTYGDLLFSVNS